MRTGVLTLQQALTAEVATVLMHSLNLARRRGHAQVTPLHVAATLMSSSSASSDLLRRACLKSQPPAAAAAAAASHHLQCRALELCFNVALNRLPTASPPSSGASLLPPPASLSNSLVAALKRAQANQRRGCIELQQQQPQPPPLLTVKVELEQLMLSILDDPSVSRVMKEAGFSSSCVKNLLEEKTVVLTQPSQFLLDSSSLLLPPPSAPPLPPHSANEDLRAVMEAMTRKERKRPNVVVVGDSTSMREALVAELMGRMERGEVPNELKHASFVNLQFSPNHLRVMSKGEVESKVSDLRRTVTSLASERGAAGVVIFTGDLMWAVDEEERREADGGGFDSVEHMVAEMGHLLSEVQSGINGGGKVWFLATASYQTYTKCLTKRPWLVAQWALQPVGVPCGWLALGLQAYSCLDNRVSRLGNVLPFQLLEPRIQAPEENEKLDCCEECAFNFEKEVLAFKFDRNHKEFLVDLRRKWNKLCQSLHYSTHSHLRTPLFKNYYSTPSLSSWWPGRLFSVPSLKLNGGGFSIAGADRKPERESSRESLNSTKMSSADLLVQTSLALSGTLFSDSATSKDQTRMLMADTVDLQRQLQEEIPWQSKSIPLIVNAIYECIHRDNKVARLLIRGSDRVAKRRLALVMAKSFFGSTDKFVHIKRDDSCLEILIDGLRNDPKCVFLIEDFDRTHASFVESFKEGLKIGSLEDAFGGVVSLADAIFILTESNSTEFEVANCESKRVVMLRLQVEDPATCGVKRKPWELESDAQNRLKKSRAASEHAFDLNSQANEESEEENDDEEEEVVPSDLTHETDCMSLHPPLLESTVQLTLDAGSGAKADLLAKIHRAFEETDNGKDEKGELLVDQTVAEELQEASGSFLESFFEGWLRQVFQAGVSNAEKGGKKLRLSSEGKERNVEEFGYLNSVLPNRILVELEI